jgi:hypothetical protein
MQTATLSRPSETAEAPPADDASLWTRAVLEQQLALLGELAELGMDIARGLARQAKGETDIDVARGDIALAYGRAARAVRFTIALQSKLIADFQGFGRKMPQAPGDDDSRVITFSWDDQGQGRKAGAARILGRVIAAEADSQEAGERLTREANERLDDPTLCGDLNRPFSEIVADICRDLGLSPDWAVLSQEAWAREELASGRPGAPLKTPRPLDGVRNERQRRSDEQVGSGGERTEADGMAQEAAPQSPTRQWRREHPHPCPSPLEGEGKIELRRSTA